MYQFVLLFHVFAAICLIALVLVQQGKGATMGAAFGSGASQTVFGSRGSGSFLFRVTIGFILVFFITSIALNYITARAVKEEKVFSLPMQGQVVPAKKVPVQLQMPAPTQVPVTNQPASAPNKQ